MRFVFKIRRKLLSYVWQLFCSLWSNINYNFLLVDGSRFTYPLNSAIGRALFTGGFETVEVEFMRQSLNPGNIFFDVGANAGIFTIIAAKKVGLNGHVYAFEPGKRELELLKHNIAINNLTNVTVIETAITNKKGVTNFAISRDGAMNSLAQTDHPKQQIESWQTIEITTLDNVLEELNISQVDFLKIDVEGAEGLVIEGAKKLLLSENSPTILFEASDLNVRNFGYSVTELICKLESEKFFIHYFDEKDLLTPIVEKDSRIGKGIYNFVALKKAVVVNR